MITEIRLYGRLGKKFGRRWKLDIHSPAEIAKAISLKHPDFKAALVGHHFGVTVGGAQIGENRLLFPSRGKTITITPIVSGSAGKGWIQVIAGIALIAVGAVTAFYFPGNPFSAYLIGMGISLALGGVAQLLSPSPGGAETDAQNKTRPSYLFTSIVNSVGQGECVPAHYGGPGWLGSAVVSASYEAVDITQGSTSGSNTSNVGSGIAAQPVYSDKVLPP